MQNNIKTFHIISSVVLAIAIFVVGFYVGSVKVNQASQPVLTEGSYALIMIDSGDDSLSVYEDTAFVEGDTVFDSLMRLEENGDVELTYEDYGGEMGVFLQGIDGVGVEGASGNKWWHYWVNGSYAQVGVSSQEIHPGDIVLFKYMPAQESLVNE